VCYLRFKPYLKCVNIRLRVSSHRLPVHIENTMCDTPTAVPLNEFKDEYHLDLRLNVPFIQSYGKYIYQSTLQTMHVC